tara:strand:- start:129 stop:422 length:294 start_codon:yes stop_codon:yes gene_type:complete
MSASKRRFEEWAKGFCDFENMDRPFNGYHNYPTTLQLRELYSLNVEPTFANAIALGKFNDGEWRCLQIGEIDNKVGVHISTCRGCYDGKLCETGEEE